MTTTERTDWTKELPSDAAVIRELHIEHSHGKPLRGYLKLGSGGRVPGTGEVFDLSLWFPGSVPCRCVLRSPASPRDEPFTLYFTEHVK